MVEIEKVHHAKDRAVHREQERRELANVFCEIDVRYLEVGLSLSFCSSYGRFWTHKRTEV